MNTTVQAITYARLAWVFVPVAIVIAILYRWTGIGNTSVYAVARMLIQLLLIGFVLAYIFEADHAGIIIAVLIVMLVAASWIAMRPLEDRNPRLFAKMLISITVGGVPVLLLVTEIVLSLEPWFLPRYVIPLAGMIFANSMNTVSLAAERFDSERSAGMDYEAARSIALKASLIPVVNSLFAVGLVSLPGMMTGQILSGVSPFVAAKYQIVVMCMLFGAAGISAALYLAMSKVSK